MPSGEAREESELLLEEVAISETTNLESALENLKIQVGGAPLNIACCHQSASASAKLSCENWEHKAIQPVEHLCHVPPSVPSIQGR